MRVLVLGGDGFCGWPTALHLSAKGWDVTVVDNLSRRNIDNELEIQSLTPIRTMGERIKAWKAVSGRDIGFVNMTVGKEFDRLVALIRDLAPDSVVHFAEQRAAPYSMKSARHKLYTVDNNINATHHLLGRHRRKRTGRASGAPWEPWGSMATATAGLRIPEGYLKVTVDTDAGPRRTGNPVPAQSGQHLSYDQDPGRPAVPVLRPQRSAADHRPAPGHRLGRSDARDAKADARLINRFDYDGDYGTVLNRFPDTGGPGSSADGAWIGRPDAGLHPYPGHGALRRTGAEEPRRAAARRVKILNQMTESRRVRDLARMVGEPDGG